MRIFFLVMITLIILAVALTSQYLLLERFFILAATLLFFSFLIALSGLWGIKGRLVQPSRYQQAGNVITNEAVIENTTILPKPFLDLKVKTNIRRYTDPSVIINLASRTVFNWYLPITFPHRGIYRIGPLFAESTDPFGLFRLHKKLDIAREVLICPPTLDLPLFTLTSEQNPGSLRYGHELAQSGSLIAGVRDYVLGDSLSRIHWRSTAHRGKLVVKEYDSEFNDKVWLILDLNKNHLFGTGIETTEEYSITIAASILKKCCDAGQPVGLIAQGSSYFYFPPRTGSPNARRILESMALMKADAQIPLSSLLNKAHEQLDQKSTAVVISACIDEDLTEAVIRTRKRGIKVTAILLDSLSFGGRLTADRAAALLRSLDIPTYIIKKGANLAEALNNKTLSVN